MGMAERIKMGVVMISVCKLGEREKDGRMKSSMKNYLKSRLIYIH